MRRNSNIMNLIHFFRPSLCRRYVTKYLYFVHLPKKAVTLPRKQSHQKRSPLSELLYRYRNRIIADGHPLASSDEPRQVRIERVVREHRQEHVILSGDDQPKKQKRKPPRLYQQHSKNKSHDQSDGCNDEEEHRRI